MNEKAAAARAVRRKPESKEPTRFFYHVIPGDYESPRVYVSREELLELERKVSTIAVAGYKDKENPPSAEAQKAAALLLSLSFHCYGGVTPYSRHAAHRFPGFSYDFYKAEYFYFFMYYLPKFDRSRGSWPWMASRIRGRALQSTVAYLRKCDNKNKMMSSFLDCAQERGYMDSESRECVERHYRANMVLFS